MMTKPSPRRGGIILIAVLVCVGVVTSLMLTAMASAIRSHRQLRIEHQYEQTRRLATAGARRWASGHDGDGDAEVWDAGGALPNHEVAIVRWHDQDPRGGQRPQGVIGYVTAEIRAAGPAGVITRFTLPIEEPKDDE